MNPIVERIKLSEAAKNQLIGLKRKTKIQQWNILARWALMYSLKEPNQVSPVPITTDSNVEMSWSVFAGPWSDIIIAAFRQRCSEDGLPLDDDVLALQFKLHLHRGIAYMSSDFNFSAKDYGSDRIPHLLEVVLDQSPDPLVIEEAELDVEY